MASHLRKRRKAAVMAVRNAGIYSRVSRLDPNLSEEESESIASQDDECREACEERSWPIYREYADPGISASEFAKVRQRPDWDALLADIKAGAVQVVVIWETSRGDRKPIDWMLFLSLCREHDCLVHIVSHDIDRLGTTYDMSRPEDLDKLSREGLDNARESSKTSGRLKRLKRRRRARGLPDGTYPYGYRRVYNEHTGKIVSQEPDPATAPHVRRVFALLAASASSKDVKKRLRADGVAMASEVEGGFPEASIRWMALNPAYISVIEFDEEQFDAQWRPVLYIPGEHRDNCEDLPLSDGSACPGCQPDRATFYKVQSIFAARKLAGARPGAGKYMLSCLGECGVEGCVSYIGVQPGKPRVHKIRGKEYLVNVASKYACLDGHLGINMEDLNTHVSAVIVAYYSKPGRYEQLIKTDDSEVMAAQADIDRIDAELNDLYARARAGRLSAMMAESLEHGLQEQLEEAKTRRVSAVPPAVRDLLEGPVEELAQRWVDMPMAAKRDIIRATVRVVIHPAGGRGRRVPVAERVEVLPARKT